MKLPKLKKIGQEQYSNNKSFRYNTMKDEKFFPPLPTFIKVKFQDTHWSTFEYFQSIFANNSNVELLRKTLNQIYPKKNITLLNSGAAAIFTVFKEIRAKDKSRRNQIILPSFACPIVVKAVYLSGCQPIYVDIDSDFGINIKDLKRKITKKTLAIVPVHQYGLLEKNIDKISNICRKNKIYLVDDSAVLGPFQEKKYSYDYKIISFNLGKNIFGIGGGAIISEKAISTPIEKQKADLKKNTRAVVINIKWKRIVTPLFKLLIKMRLTHRNEDMSLKKISFEPILCKSIGNAQAFIARKVLKRFEQNIYKERKLAGIYIKELRDIPYIVLPEKKYNTFTKFTILCDKRYDLASYLSERGIETQWTYFPVHLQEPNPNKHKSLKNTDRLWKKTLSLPLYPQMSENEVIYVCDEVKKWIMKQK